MHGRMFIKLKINQHEEAFSLLPPCTLPHFGGAVLKDNLLRLTLPRKVVSFNDNKPVTPLERVGSFL